MCADSSGRWLYVVDHDDHLIRVLDTSSSSTSILVGTGGAGSADGVGTNAQVNHPVTCRVMPGNDLKLFVPDNGNGKVRLVKLPAGGGSGGGLSTITSFASVGNLWDLVIDSSGVNL